MPSSERWRAYAVAGVLAGVSAFASRANAQPKAEGFAVDRLYTSAPGGGWFVMDSLDMHGGLGGAISLTSGYAKDPLRVTDGVTHLALVSDEAFANFGFAVTYDRWRAYLNFDMPLANRGQSGTLGGETFTAPYVTLSSSPDTLADTRFGIDGRFYGEATSPFRLGASAQLFVPSGGRADYVSDGSYRAMLRVSFAGDVGALTYAGHLGVHLRPLDDAPTAGSPRGSELLFGVAAGSRFLLGQDHRVALVIGPEVFGESALRSFFQSNATGVEGLISGRIEGTREDGAEVRLKLGVGAGLDEHFGAPEWRIVGGIEVFNRGAK